MVTSPSFQRSPSSMGRVTNIRRFWSATLAALGFSARTSITGSPMTTFL
jgi:hypothetical protein